MSWGHATSTDMLIWKQHSVSPALVPDQSYDCQGVFTGCFITPTDKTDKTLRVAYSSVKELPFHWSTPPYPRDAAGISIATSGDGGDTWTKASQNPILQGEPAGLDVSGFRDPSVTASTSLDTLREDSSALYGLVSGGIVNTGPTTFLYRICKSSVDNWTYLNPLVDIPMRFQPSMRWSGNYGTNWECTNLMNLSAGAVSRDFLIIGAEGDVEKVHVLEGSQHGSLKRTIRSQLWMSGHLKMAGDGVKFAHEHGGFLDNGPYYAANTFHDSKLNRRIAHGWLPEEDLPMNFVHQKGWNGSLAIPRELFLLRIPNVVGALRSNLADIYSFEVLEESEGTKTILTLGIRPIAELSRLRESCRRVNVAETPLLLPPISHPGATRISGIESSTWELQAVIRVHPGCETVGFHINHSDDLKTRTSVYFCAIDEMVVVDRHASTTDARINTCPDAGPFTLLRRSSPEAPEPHLEQLDIRIISDADILEVFVNDRFALATMVYSDPGNPFVSAFATGDANSAVFEKVMLWDGLRPK
jgi:beta-fructofuranosidase